jgi:adenylate cyclase
MESHRQEITVVFCDLRNFTEFSATAEPEEQLRVLREYHNAVGSLIFRYEATLEHFAGDGVMAFFNDPVPCPDPAARAIKMAIAMREEVGKLRVDWDKRGFELGFGVGIALGYATLGQVGFEGQFHYMAIGSVANLASRLCDQAEDGQILITQRVYADVEEIAEVEPAGELTFKGFHKPVPAYQLLRVNSEGSTR